LFLRWCLCFSVNASHQIMWDSTSIFVCIEIEYWAIDFKVKFLEFLQWL
jgi:hypothetical protein